MMKLSNKILLIAVLTAASLFYECKKNGTEPPPIVPPDTTTHKYTWTIHQFGAGAASSYLNDVFAISENDVWAVGKITTDSIDYNVIHWNGIEWNLDRVLYSNIAVAGQAVYGLSANELFVVAGTTFKWNGTNWIDLNAPFGIFDGPVTRFWGTSSSSLYFVGGNGTLVHYDGSQWQKLQSGTQMNILDIWGFDDGSFYCVAGTGIGLPNELLIYKNGILQKKITHQRNLKNSLWGASHNNVYAVGEGLFHYDGTDSLRTVQWPATIPKFAMSSIRGTARNNVFIVGAFGFVMHFNGLDWRYYDEVYADNILKSVSVFGTDVFAVGTDGYNAYIYHGKKVSN